MDNFNTDVNNDAFEKAVTNAFQTKTVFLKRRNISADNYWPVALDIGYSSVKGFSPNFVYCFPSFARKFTGQLLSVGEPGENDIQYRDENGTWNVGHTAQAQISSDDTNDGIATLFGRNRYFSPMFLVLARTGLGMGMIANEFGNPNGKKLVLQTGLPPAYLKADAKYMREVLATRHVFELRVGKGKWHRFDFELKPENIKIMSQPMGSLLSAAIDNNCRQIADANDLFTSNVLIMDAGFGTVDTFSARHREIESPQSFDDAGMKAVLMETCEGIYKRYGVDIQIHAMQKALEDGYVKVFDHRSMKTSREPFADILRDSSKRICDTVIERMKVMYNNLIDYDYLLITGGTGAAWKEQIADHFSGMEGLKVISGGQNDDLSDVFSNVRGYYLYLTGLLRKTSGNR